MASDDGTAIIGSGDSSSPVGSSCLRARFLSGTPRKRIWLVQTGEDCILARSQGKTSIINAIFRSTETNGGWVLAHIEHALLGGFVSDHGQIRKYKQEEQHGDTYSEGCSHSEEDPHGVGSRSLDGKCVLRVETSYSAGPRRAEGLSRSDDPRERPSQGEIKFWIDGWQASAWKGEELGKARIPQRSWHGVSTAHIAMREEEKHGTHI